MPSGEYERRLINILPEPMLLLDRDGSIVSANHGALDLFETTADQIVGCKIDGFVETSAEAFRAYLQDCSRSSQFHIGRFSFQSAKLAPTLCRCDGARLAHNDNHLLVLRLTPRGQSSTPFHSLNEQIETLNRARHGLEHEVRNRTRDLLEAQERLRELSARLMQAQDEERRKLARELHDSTGQILTAIQLNLSLSLRGVPGDSDIATRLTQTIDLTNQVIGEIRTVSHLLHPPLLDEAGLSLALTTFVEGFEERSQISVALDLPPITDRLPLELETALFRIVQECLTNIHRHSGSTEASVRLTVLKGLVGLEVRDKGRGIGEVNGSNGHKMGVGISGMRERVRLLGGTFEISGAHPGTLVSVELPVQAADAGQKNNKGKTVAHVS
jgi:signal transduction histidine kinase